jgi:hypothetical protein
VQIEDGRDEFFGLKKSAEICGLMNTFYWRGGCLSVSRQVCGRWNHWGIHDNARFPHEHEDAFRDLRRTGDKKVRSSNLISRATVEAEQRVRSLLATPTQQAR